jgi:hypothetical protein
MFLKAIFKETEVGIEHLNSRLQYNLKRADTPHLVSATFYDSHDHSNGKTDKPPQVRGLAREALAQKSDDEAWWIVS